MPPCLNVLEINNRNVTDFHELFLVLSELFKISHSIKIELQQRLIWRQTCLFSFFPKDFVTPTDKA